MLVALPELHKALQGKPVADMLHQWLMDISGLSLPLLQHLYRKCPLPGKRSARVCEPRFKRSKARITQMSGR